MLCATAATAVRGVLCVAAALCAVAALPGAAVADQGTPDPYAYDPGARTVQGAASESAAESIQLGAAYRSTIGPSGGSQGTLYYRLELGAAENVYASATAVPGLGTKADFADGLTVRLQDADGHECSEGAAQFGSAERPWPVAATATRTIDPDSADCQKPGTYYLVVERESTAGLDEWGIELSTASEPATVRKPGPAVPPGDGNPASPRPPAAGQAGQRHGGTGFSTAAGLGEGVWQDSVRPGQTLFYRVPVGWGQRVSATAELTGPDGAPGGSTGRGSVGSALVMWLYNPVRGHVGSADAAFAGRQSSASLPSPAPVSYRNRYSTDPQVAAMRFAGWYYLAVNLSPQLADGFGDGGYRLTLRVAVDGAAQEGPGYVGAPQPQELFDVPGGGAVGRADTTTGTTDDGPLRQLGITALGVGTALLLTLAAWTLLARRPHAAATPRRSAATRATTATIGRAPDRATTGGFGPAGPATDEGTDSGTVTGEGFGHVPGYSDTDRYGSGYAGPEYGGHGAHGEYGAHGGDHRSDHGGVTYGGNRGRVEYGAGSGGGGASAQYGVEYGRLEYGYGRSEYGGAEHGTGFARGADAVQHGGTTGRGTPQGGADPYGSPEAW